MNPFAGTSTYYVISTAALGGKKPQAVCVHTDDECLSRCVSKPTVNIASVRPINCSPLAPFVWKEVAAATKKINNFVLGADELSRRAYGRQPIDYTCSAALDLHVGPTVISSRLMTPFGKSRRPSRSVLRSAVVTGD